MYIQPASEGPFFGGAKNEPILVPKGYSGSAFDRTSEATAAAAAVESAPEPQVEAEAPAETPEAAAEVMAGPESVPASGGLFSRVPLLSSLLPPRRRGREGGGNSDLLTLGLLFLLLREDGDNDLLPFLPLLLFWS